MDTHFDEELARLKQKLLRMADIAQQMIRLSVESLTQRKEACAQEVFQLEDEVNHLEIEILERVIFIEEGKNIKHHVQENG